jgi:hypothetical protein
LLNASNATVVAYTEATLSSLTDKKGDFYTQLQSNFDQLHDILLDSFVKVLGVDKASVTMNITAVKNNATKLDFKFKYGCESYSALLSKDGLMASWAKLGTDLIGLQTVKLYFEFPGVADTPVAIDELTPIPPSLPGPNDEYEPNDGFYGFTSFYLVLLLLGVLFHF